MFDQGVGPPLIVIPGVQGRWEWMQPALAALQTRCRTIAYSLCGDVGSARSLDPALGFDNYLRQLDAVFEQTGIQRAALCGVSYGGLIALRYAATRPERVSAHHLPSAPAPGLDAVAAAARYIARPWLLGAGVRGDVADAGLAGDPPLRCRAGASRCASCCATACASRPRR